MEKNDAQYSDFANLKKAPTCCDLNIFDWKFYYIKVNRFVVKRVCGKSFQIIISFVVSQFLKTIFENKFTNYAGTKNFLHTLLKTTLSSIRWWKFHSKIFKS